MCIKFENIHELFNDKDKNEQINTRSRERESSSLWEEIKWAVMKSMSRRATHPNDMATELLRFGGEITVTKLLRFGGEITVTKLLITVTKLHEWYLWRYGRPENNGQKNKHNEHSFRFPGRAICFSATITELLHYSHIQARFYWYWSKHSRSLKKQLLKNKLALGHKGVHKIRLWTSGSF